MLTRAGQDQGFTLSTFASGFPGTNNIGPLGIVFPSGGGVLVSDYPGNVRLFPSDTDNQTAGTVSQNYGQANATGLTMVGNNVYMAQQARGAVVQLNPNGTWNQDIVGGLGHATGIVTDPANGHLLVSTAGGGANLIYDVDPTTGASRVLFAANVDGLAISPDGKTLYGAGGNSHVLGYDLATGNLVFDSGAVPGDVDGTALGTGSLAGNIFANTHAGTIVEVNLATGLQTVIAEGGSRGDFAAADPNNGSLLLTQSDSIVRLTPPAGGGFGPFTPLRPDASPAPEPSSLALLALGGGALAVWRGWRKRKAA
jgi:WD40 repeat protein